MSVLCIAQKQVTQLTHRGHAMNNLEDITKAIETLSENQAKALELQTVYYSNLAKQLTEGSAELAEQTRLHLEAIAKVDTFTSAFESNVKFEDGVKAKITSFYQDHAETAKKFYDDLAKLYGLTEASAKTEPKKAVKETKAA